MAEEDVVNNSNVELASHIIDNSLHQSTKKLYCLYLVLGSSPWTLYSSWSQWLELNLIATTREGANTSKEFYAHISKKEIRIFGKGIHSLYIDI